jgi:hypothetical protein
MKKTTFIVAITLFAAISLTGCGNKNAKELESLRNEVAIMQEELSSLQASKNSEPAIIERDTTSITEEKTATETQAQTQTEFEETTTKTKAESTLRVVSTSLTIPQISLADEKIQAAIIYCGNSFEIQSSSDATSIHSIDLPYYGKEVRDVDLVLSGITVNAIYSVSDTFNPIEKIEYSSVDNEYLASLHITGSDANIFLVQTVNGSHYYIGIKY